MRDIVFYDLNLFAIFLLVTLLIVIYSKHEVYSLRGHLFRWLILVTISLLTLEIFSWVFDGVDGNTAYTLNLTFNTLFNIISISVPCIWAFYIDYTIFEDTKRIKNHILIYTAPVIINIVLAIVNLFYPILFTISTDNIYSRLSGIWIGVIFTYLIYLYLLTLVIKNRQRLTSNFVIGVMMFLFFPLIASVIQILHYGLLLIWPTTSVAIVFSYLLFETTSASLDFLTGVFTRSRAEDYIKILLKKKKPFSVLIMDVDDFKMINDQYGHHTGDKVLIELGKILHQVFHPTDVVARLGGDEFIVVTESLTKTDVNEVRQEINQLLASSVNPYIQGVRVSVGISICEEYVDCSMESIISNADNNMYLDKAHNKNQNRRKDDKQ